MRHAHPFATTVEVFLRRIRDSVAGERRDSKDRLDARLLPAALCCWITTLVVIRGGWPTGVVVAVVVSATGMVVWGRLWAQAAGGPEPSGGTAIAGWVGRVIRLGGDRSAMLSSHGGIGARPRGDTESWAEPLRSWGIGGPTRRHRTWVTVVVAASGLTLGFALSAGLRGYQVDLHPLGDMGEKARIEVTVTPSGDPKPLRGTSFGGQRWVVRAELREFRRGGVLTRGGGAVVVLAGGSGWAALSPGQPITFDARVSPPDRRDLTVAVLRAEGEPVIAGPLPWWQRVAGVVRADLRTAAVRSLPEEAAGLLPALVVGDTAGLADSVREEFEIAGLQHLCVVSGANFAIVGTTVLAGARRLTLGPRASVGVAAGAMAMFVVIARPDPSVLRAAAMGAVTLLALLTGRRRQALPALCAAVVGVLLIWPELAVSAGFALSVLATGGLILLAPGWSDRLRDRGWWRLPAELVAVSAAAFTVTAPIMVALTGRVSVVAIAANVLVAPVVAPITVIGALAAAVAWLWQPLGQAVLHLAAAPMWWLLTVADRASALPGAAIDVPDGTVGGIGAAAVALFVVLLFRSRAPTGRRGCGLGSFGGEHGGVGNATAAAGRRGGVCAARFRAPGRGP